MGSNASLRILVTGARGFVGPYVIRALQDLFGDAADIIATSSVADSGGTCMHLDVTDRSLVLDAINRVRPTHLIHLAAVADFATAQAGPDQAWATNVRGSLNVAKAILERAPQCTMIFVGSGQVYGSGSGGTESFTEDMPLSPENDYAVTKAAADLAIGALALRGLRCVRLRPFNHTGPGQGTNFVVPSFAFQIAQIEAGLCPPTIQVGNLEVERDFLDVRDVADAYARAVRHSDAIAPGTILNVASGVPRRIGSVLDALLAESEARISIVSDRSRIRGGEASRAVGNAERAHELLGWKPMRPWEETLRETLFHFRSQVQAGRARD